MLIFAIIIAGSYGPQPYPGPIVGWMIIIIVIIACISGIANRKKLDEIKDESKDTKHEILPLSPEDKQKD